MSQVKVIFNYEVEYKVMKGHVHLRNHRLLRRLMETLGYKQTFSLQVVPVPVPVWPARRQQTEKLMCWVVGVLNNPASFYEEACVVDVLLGWAPCRWKSRCRAGLTISPVWPDHVGSSLMCKQST